MKKIVATVFVLFSLLNAGAQQKDWRKETLDRASDHFMIQLTNDRWSGVPDSISSHMGGLSRGFGVSFLFDKPFKTDPRWSVAFGLGVNGSSIFFNRMAVDVKATGTRVLPFRNLDSADHFKKYKLVTAYLEVPVELRYVFSPQKGNKSWKAAIGAKVSTLINAHTKGKTLQDKNGTTINSYTEKESKRTFFNTNRFMLTGRVGIGHFSLVCNYSLTGLLKDGSGPEIRPYQIGLCISGL